MSVTKIRRDSALMLRSRLDPSSPAFNASEHIRKLLSDKQLQNYLYSWVYPVIGQCAGYQQDWHKQREYISQDAARAHSALTLSVSKDPMVMQTIKEQLELYNS